MIDNIRRIIDDAKEYKREGISDKNIAMFVHIELGKLINYNNNYTAKMDGIDIGTNAEGTLSSDTLIRQERLLNEPTNANNIKQICKGMAELYTAILNEIGINALSVAVKSKEEVEGETREDGTTIHNIDSYSCSFNEDFSINAKEVVETNNHMHWYSIINTEEGEYISDLLSENALSRIKIGESNLSHDNVAGFHKKEEHKTRVTNKIILDGEFGNIILNKYNLYCQNNESDNKAIEFIFELLKYFESKFGFEEVKSFFEVCAYSLPRGEIDSIPTIINLVKETEESCDVISIYQFNDKKYLIRSGIDSSNYSNGEIDDETIKEIISDSYEPRKLSDAKKLRDLEIHYTKIK